MKVRFAVTPIQRLVGLGAVRGDEALLLAPCRDVHTFGMTRPIDVAFVDACGIVLSAERSVPPLQRRRCAHAAAVLERYEQCRSPWFLEGDRVEIDFGNGAKAVTSDDFKAVATGEEDSADDRGMECEA